MCLCAQSIEHSCEFHSNITGSYYCHLLRLMLKLEEAITVDAIFGSRDALRNSRVSTSRKQDLLRVNLDLGAIIESDDGLILAYEARSAVNIFNALVLEVTLVYAVQVLDICVSLLFESLPIEGGSLFNREAVGFGVAYVFCQTCGVPGDLLWYTSMTVSICVDS